jgi:5'-nucleotidase
VGLGITISGTVGAALEAASLGCPALAVSLQAHQRYHFSYSKDIDFSAAAHFAAFFGGILLEEKMPPDVHVLKLDVPSTATPQTPWQLTRVSRQRYYDPVRPERSSWDVPGTPSYTEAVILEGEDEDSDVYALRKKQCVSVTPLSLDMTSRLELDELEKQLRE